MKALTAPDQPGSVDGAAAGGAGSPSGDAALQQGPAILAEHLPPRRPADAAAADVAPRGAGLSGEGATLASGLGGAIVAVSR